MQTTIDTAEAVRSGRLSAREALVASRAAVEAGNGPLNAFVFLDWNAAEAAAAAIDRAVAAGRDPGPLAGVPFGVKDLDDCAGMPTTQGSLFYRDSPPKTVDSPLVARLRAAGAVPIGKTAAAEFGMDSATSTRAFGPTRNPWNLATTPGGSSGGSSAAVAAGLVPFATGSDGGGSVRSPAAFTNLVGHKPSHGRLPRRSGGSDVSTPGFLTTTVADTARLYDVASGPHPIDRMTLPAPTVRYEEVIETLPVQGLIAAWSPDLGYAPAEREVVDIAHDAAMALVDAAGLRLADTRPIFTNAVVVWVAMACAEMQADLVQAGILPDHRDLLSDQVLRALDRAASDLPTYLAAQQGRRKLEREVGDFFGSHDILFTPVVACRAFRAEGMRLTEVEGRDASQTGVEPFTMLANMSWIPAISVPAGFTSDGLPVGLQIMTRLHADDVALRLARIVEQVRPWPRLAPGYV